MFYLNEESLIPLLKFFWSAPVVYLSVPTDKENPHIENPQEKLNERQNPFLIDLRFGDLVTMHSTLI